MNKLTRIFALIILCNSSFVLSDEINIVVVGLFSSQAVVEINQTQRLLKVGQTSPEGVKLVSANSRQAVLEWNGKQQTYPLGQHIASSFKTATEIPSVTLWSNNGHYLTAGTINGYTVDFLVDTGATSITLNAPTAKRLGINYFESDPVGVKTASDIVHGYPVVLDLVQVGDIKLHNIRAVVLDGEQPSVVLLGMTFLGQLDMKQTDKKLELKQKF